MVKFFLGCTATDMIYKDLSIFPHLLIGGNTGCGKSVLLKQIIDTINCGCILIDPKKVEFTPLKNKSKVVNNSVYSTQKEIDSILYGLRKEMEKRYNFLTENGLKNIYQTNGHIKPIAVFFDEYADTTTQQRNTIIHLLRLSRAAGIHFILATQRPSTKIISGDIKANIPCRIAMHTATSTDSRVIIDGFSGAVDIPNSQGYFYFSDGSNNPILMRSIMQ